MDRKFLKLNVDDWVCGTVKKVINLGDWDKKWIETYFELGGSSLESGNKGCPKNAVKTLWYLGRLKCCERPYLNWDYKQILDFSKNGLYAVLTLDILDKHPSLSLIQVWQAVKKKFKDLFPNVDCSESNQGGSTLAFKLWHLKEIKSLNIDPDQSFSQ